MIYENLLQNFMEFCQKLDFLEMFFGFLWKMFWISLGNVFGFLWEMFLDYRKVGDTRAQSPPKEIKLQPFQFCRKKHQKHSITGISIQSDMGVDK